MMPLSPTETALQLLIAALFPLRLLFSCRKVGRRSSFLAVLATVSATLVASGWGSGVSTGIDVAAMRAEIDALKLRIAKLELILEENVKILNSRTDTLAADRKVVETMERDIEHLMREQDDYKKSLGNSNLYTVKDMENEVHALKEESQKMKKDIHNIESLAMHAEKKVEALRSEVKKIESIVTEQWIQVRQFEQAFQFTKVMASNVYKRSRSMANDLRQFHGKQRLIKFIEDIRIKYLNIDDIVGPLSSAMSFTMSSMCSVAHFKRGFKFVQKCYCKVSHLLGAIHSHNAQELDHLNVFFLGCSESKRCISNVINPLKNHLLAAHRFHQEFQGYITDFVRSTCGEHLLCDAIIFILECEPRFFGFIAGILCAHLACVVRLDAQFTKMPIDLYRKQDTKTGYMPSLLQLVYKLITEGSELRASSEASCKSFRAPSDFFVFKVCALKFCGGLLYTDA